MRNLNEGNSRKHEQHIACYRPWKWRSRLLNLIVRDLGALGNKWVSYINSLKSVPDSLDVFVIMCFLGWWKHAKIKVLHFKKNQSILQEFRPLFSKHWPVMIYVKRITHCQLHQRRKAERSPLQSCGWHVGHCIRQVLHDRCSVSFDVKKEWVSGEK